MRTVELAQIAFNAEGLHLRRIVVRYTTRAGFGIAAGTFALATLATLHLVMFETALLWLSAVWATCVVLGIDLAAVGALALLAVYSPPDTIEMEAGEIHNEALLELRRSVTMRGVARNIVGKRPSPKAN